MDVITAPNRAQVSTKSLFLAGGISRCPDWQQEMLAMLPPVPLTVFNPRRPDFDVRKTEESIKQIEWEHEHLNKADAISFWFPKETDCPITLFELGAWSKTKKPIFVGCHKDYRRAMDVEIQLRLQRPDVRVWWSLEELVADVRRWATEAKRLLLSDHGYKAPYLTYDKNEAFWEEVLVGRTIRGVSFDDKGISSMTLDSGQIVGFDLDGYRLAIKD